MDRQAVSSSNVAEVGYDPESETLEILFRSGGCYQYYNVPPIVYEQLMQASSLGGFVNREIKGRFAEARC